MKHYELFYLVSGSVPETELESLKKEVNSWITKDGGKVTKDESWGRKKLSYPINKEQHGFYFLSEFDGEPNLLKVLQKKLKLQKEIVRYILTHKKPISEKELEKQKQAEKRIQARAAQQATERFTRETAKKEKVEKPEEPKIKLEELDKKLDELLDQDIVK